MSADVNAKAGKKKVILFSGMFFGAGGAERLLLEEVKYLEQNGFEARVLTFYFREEVLFNQAYQANIEQIGYRTSSNNLLIKSLFRIANALALRRRLRQIKPDVIISSSAWGCVYLYLATLFTSYPYATYIHGSIFWFHEDLLKYTFIHRKVFHEIRESVVGHKEFIPVKPPKVGWLKKITNEFLALAIYRAVRKAKKVFVHSNQMKWEVGKLYGKEAVVVKGAFAEEIFTYKPRQDIKKKLGLSNKRMILNINRLEARKRVDLLIKAFKRLSEHVEDAVLVIGGIGEDEEMLKNLAQQLNLADKVRFLGYIREEELWDYIAACDIFVHPNWADFAIAAYEPLALQKKVVWSTEMEVDEHLTGNKHIFLAHPTVGDFAQAMEKALATEVTEKNDLSVYTWNHFCERIIKEIQAL